MRSLPTLVKGAKYIVKAISKTAKKTPVSIKKVDDGYLKKKGIDAHEVKKDVLGRKAKISEYDLYVNKKSGELMSIEKVEKGKEYEQENT